MLQPAREPMAHRIFEPRMVQHRRIDETAERGLGRADLFGLAPHLAPDRIVALDLRLGRREWTSAPSQPRSAPYAIWGPTVY